MGKNVPSCTLVPLGQSTNPANEDMCTAGEHPLVDCDVQSAIVNTGFSLSDGRILCLCACIKTLMLMHGWQFVCRNKHTWTVSIADRKYERFCDHCVLKSPNAPVFFFSGHLHVYSLASVFWPMILSISKMVRLHKGHQSFLH